VLGHYLPARDHGSNTIKLAANVTTDLHRLRAASRLAKTLPPTDALTVLNEAIETLVVGIPFDATGYDWAHEQQFHAEACVLVETTVLQLVDLAVEVADLSAARAAIVAGLRSLRVSEPLERAQDNLHWCVAQAAKSA
jgi:hypothetical protein